MPFWYYCKSCGQQTPEPNQVTVGNCDCEGNGFWSLDMTDAELEELQESGLTVKQFAEKMRAEGRLKDREW